MTQCLIWMTQFLLFICIFPVGQFHLLLLQASSYWSQKVLILLLLFSFPVTSWSHSLLLPEPIQFFSLQMSPSKVCSILVSSNFLPYKTQKSSVFHACSSLLDSLPIWSDTLQYPMPVFCQNLDLAHTPKCLCLLRFKPSMISGQVERSLKANWTKLQASAGQGCSCWERSCLRLHQMQEESGNMAA